MLEKVFNMFGFYTREQYFKVVRENNRLALSLQVSEEVKVRAIKENEELRIENEDLKKRN